MLKSSLRKTSAWVVFLLLSQGTNAQTLFSFGKHKVSRQEFLEAYSRNNTDTSGAKISHSEYLGLYTNFRLKLQDALDSGLDTMQSQQEELKAFRQQLAETYMREDASVELLVNEAKERLLRDIRISINNETPVWITAFLLPYEAENLVYTSAVGSTVNYKNAAIKILEERPAIGQVRAAQILLFRRPEIADSLYQALQKGASFDSLAQQFSDDNLTYQRGGEMLPFGVGKYSPEFEDAAFALAKDGDISKPVKTEFGYHIIKRLERIPVRIDHEEVRQQVLVSDRMQKAQETFVKKVKEKIGRPELTDAAALDYYRENLENHNSEFAAQFNEFRQGNLLFAIMQQKIWDVAAADTLGLMNYFNRNQQRYVWQNSVDALVVTTLSDDQSLPNILKSLKADPSSWRKIADQSGGMVIIDSGRFELAQIPADAAIILKEYPNSEQKTFEEARGAVINDYQQQLEENWLADLRKRYPVKINKKVLRSL